MNRLSSAIRAANDAGRTAVIPFITAGFPSKEDFLDTLKSIADAGADIIEIGIPFSDPVADGPVIEDISRDSLAQGVTLAWILDELEKAATFLKVPLVLMGYTNPFYQFGLEKLAERASRLGVHGMIIPDLPLCEAESWRLTLDKYDIALIPLVAPNTPVERMREYAEVSKGFVYVVSILGTTGIQTQSSTTQQTLVEETLRRARASFSIPVALGFGLRSPDQLERLAPDTRPDAAILGSALLLHIREGGSSKSFLSPWLP